MSINSLPRKSRAVKKVMAELLMDFCLKGDEMGVTSTEGMSVQDHIEALRLLLGAQGQVTCSAKFRMGDIYNLLGKQNREARRKAMKMVAEQMSENDRQNIRTCGWVASKWPRDTRSEEHNWTYFLRNAPGVITPWKRKEMVYPAVESSLVEGGLSLSVEGPNGKRMIVFVAEPLMHPRKGFSYQREEGYGADLIHEGAAA